MSASDFIRALAYASLVLGSALSSAVAQPQRDYHADAKRMQFLEIKLAGQYLKWGITHWGQNVDVTFLPVFLKARNCHVTHVGLSGEKIKSFSYFMWQINPFSFETDIGEEFDEVIQLECVQRGCIKYISDGKRMKRSGVALGKTESSLAATLAEYYELCSEGPLPPQ